MCRYAEVVDFYARWCGACRALYPKMCKMAAAEENQNVLFLKVEFDDNKDMCRNMVGLLYKLNHSLKTPAFNP